MKLTCVSLLLWVTGSILGFVLLPGVSPSSAQDLGGIPSVTGQVDVRLILRTWRLKGVMFCPKPCLYVENAYPAGIFEAARQPFRTGLGDLSGLDKALASSSKADSSSHTDSSDGSGSTLQFSESHVYSFVPPVPLDLVIAKPASEAFAINYLSELDAFAYRTGLTDLFTHARESSVLCDLKPHDPACVGRWGNIFPRTGFVVRDSEVITSYLVAVRGGRTASSPWCRVVLKPYPFEPRVGHYIQMVSPSGKAPIAIGGGEVFAAENKSGSKDGYYAFIHYGIFEACGKCLPARLLEPRPVQVNK